MYRSREELMKSRFLTYPEGSRLYQIGTCRFRRIAREAKAIFRVGKRYLVIREVIEAYLEEHDEIVKGLVDYEKENRE